MNKTQKGTWFALMALLLNICIVVYLVVEIAILKRLPEGVWIFWPMVAFFVLMALLIIFMHKKQSPAEVDSDERDKIIQLKAVLIAFVSAWILLAAASVIPWIIVGYTGSIPAYLLPLVNVTVFLIGMTVYFVAVLFLYGRGGKDGGK